MPGRTRTEVPETLRRSPAEGLCTCRGAAGRAIGATRMNKQELAAPIASAR